MIGEFIVYMLKFSFSLKFWVKSSSPTVGPMLLRALGLGFCLFFKYYYGIISFSYHPVA